MAKEFAISPPVVLLVEPTDPKHRHAEMLTRAGLRVVRLPPHEVNSQLLDDVKPAIIAAELDGSQQSDALDLASRVREDAPPHSTPVPVIVYGHGLKAEDIERAARGGAMWLQLEPSDGLKLVAAIRGVLAATGVVIKQD
jgi:DNA-binding NarL/FixJ family response regulator